MGKKSKGVTLYFQAAQGRNVHDWTLTTLQGGRKSFQANKEGVCRRVGLILTYMVKVGRAVTEAEVGEYLQTEVHASYRKADVSAPFRQMTKCGILKSHGKGRGVVRTYTLAPEARKVWNRTNKKWINRGGK